MLLKGLDWISAEDVVYECFDAACFVRYNACSALTHYFALRCILISLG